jgi:hypothetical protein
VSGGGPAVLLDVDGVLNLARFRSSRQRDRMIRDGYFHRRPTDPFSGDRLLVNLPRAKAAVRGLLELGAEVIWATTWGPSANDYFVPLLGLPEVLRVAPVDFRCPTKASTVIPWLEGRPWAWLEDQQRELEAALALTREGTPCCPVLVDPAGDGLGSGHVQAVNDWLGSL